VSGHDQGHPQLREQVAFRLANVEGMYLGRPDLWAEHWSWYTEIMNRGPHTWAHNTSQGRWATMADAVIPMVYDQALEMAAREAERAAEPLQPAGRIIAVAIRLHRLGEPQNPSSAS
jgi:hypothetical protein